MVFRLIALVVFTGALSTCHVSNSSKETFSGETLPDAQIAKIVFTAETTDLLVAASLVDGKKGGTYGIRMLPGLHDYAVTVENTERGRRCEVPVHIFTCEGDFRSVAGQQYNIKCFTKEDRVFSRVEQNNGTLLNELPCNYTGYKEVNNCPPQSIGVFSPTVVNPSKQIAQPDSNPGSLNFQFIRKEPDKTSDRSKQNVDDLLEQGERNRSKQSPTGSKGQGKSVFDYLQGLP